MSINFSQEDFEKVVADAIDSFPDKFLRLMETGNLSISIEDEPTQDQREALKNPNGEIFGMRTGSPPLSSFSPIACWPNFIFIFKLATEKRCDTKEQLQDFVKGIIMHEVGHFFGMTEAQLAAIGELSNISKRE
jgi:predicted Zn-dependent protease with MMP-like domain